MFRKYLAAVALATVLAACGGGTDSVRAPSVSPQAVASAMRAGQRLLSAPGASAVDTANRLMNAAEAAYPQFFPSHQETQSFAPFLFRYYPETGIYLGLVVTRSSFYTLNGVYAAGAPFGSLDNPTHIGMVTDFITPTIGATAGECFDLALFDTQGTRMVVAYTYSGEASGTETVDMTVGGMTTFEGYQARETTTVVSGTYGGVSSTSTGKSYGARTGDAEVTQYGYTNELSYTSGGVTFESSMRTVLTPPYVDTMYSLAAGASATTTQRGATTTTNRSTGSPDQTTTNQFASSLTTTYVGQESVTVPAGTFNACKFETTYDGSPEVNTSWFVVGKGIHVKATFPGMAIEATSITLNGAPL